MQGLQITNRRSIHAISAWLKQRVKWCVIDTHRGKVLIAHGSTMGFMTCPDTVLDRIWDEVDHIICCHPQQVSSLYSRLFGQNDKFWFADHTGVVAVKGEDQWVAAYAKK